ncbi:MAG: cell wall-binding repeat-containing protein [Dermatophilaceae bacterium]
MSSKIKGLRRVGIVGLSTVVAASMMTLSAASSFAAAGAYTTTPTPPPLVTQGATNQTAGDLSLEFANAWTTNAAQTFTVGTGAAAAGAVNDCLTAAGIDAATGYSVVPTVTVTDPAPANIGARTPTFVTTLGSSTPACATAGIKDQVTITQGLPATGTATDTFVVTLSNVKYNVGTTAFLGAVNVVTAPVGTNGLTTVPNTVSNATVVNKNFSFIPVVAAQLTSTGNVMGTAKFVESTAGSIFTPASSSTVVTLTLNDSGTFTAGVTPTITLPAGYTVSTTTPPALGANTFTFTVNTPATLVKATVSVSGLKYSAGASTTARVATLTGVAGSFAPAAMAAVNVLDFTARTGGTDRFGTAADLFINALNNKQFVTTGTTNTTAVVLSSGVDFPDALSANYLAGRLHTGTLLTAPTTLPPATRTAILNSGVSTVYITGETGAISQGVENTITGLHVSNVPGNAFINVVRLGGIDRYATNVKTNENNFTAASTVLLASGEDFPDALALGPVAYFNTFPLILTRGKTLGATENQQLADFGPTNVVIAGGTGVVSAAIETSLTAQGYNVIRLWGADRTQTAAAVATWGTMGLANAAGTFGTFGSTIKGAQGFASDRTYIARGEDFADALAAGPVAGAIGTTAGATPKMIVLTSSLNVLGAGIPSYLGGKTVGSAANSTTQVGILHALGLTGAVPAALMKAAAAAIGQP